MPHIGSSILQIDQACSVFYILLVYVSSTNLSGIGLTSSIRISTSVKSFFKCSRSRHKHRVYSNTDGTMLSTGNTAYNRFHKHVINAGRCKDEVWVVTFLPSCTVERFY